MGRIVVEKQAVLANSQHSLTAELPKRISLPSLRHLRLFLVASDSQSMQAAALSLNTSRSSITKTIKKLEAQVGATLLTRTSRTLTLTSDGRTLAAASRRALDHLQQAELSVANVSGAPRRKFAHNVTSSQLMAFLVVVSNRSHTLAAARLQVTQPAVTMALRDLQNAVGTSLLLKSAGGISPSAAGLVLAESARNVIAELESIGDLVRAKPLCARERVVVGVLPLAGTLVPARAVESFLRSFPYANLTLVEGPYASLLRGLRAGEIDLIIGGLSSPASEPDIAHQQLYDEQIMAGVRTSHPLGSGRVVTLEQLLKYNWIIPRLNTPARTSLEQFLKGHQIEMPPNVIETNSILTTRSLLMEGDRVAFLTQSQIQLDERIGVLCTLSLDTPRPSVPVGVRLRVDCRPSDTLSGFLGHLRRSGLEYQNTH